MFYSVRALSARGSCAGWRTDDEGCVIGFNGARVTVRWRHGLGTYIGRVSWTARAACAARCGPRHTPFHPYPSEYAVRHCRRRLMIMLRCPARLRLARSSTILMLTLAAVDATTPAAVFASALSTSTVAPVPVGVAGAVSAPTDQVPVRDPRCAMADADRQWLRRALHGWEWTSRALLKLDPKPLPWIVVFDGRCTWHVNPDSTEMSPPTPRHARGTHVLGHRRAGDRPSTQWTDPSPQ